MDTGLPRDALHAGIWLRNFFRPSVCKTRELVSKRLNGSSGFLKCGLPSALFYKGFYYLPAIRVGLLHPITSHTLDFAAFFDFFVKPQVFNQWRWKYINIADANLLAKVAPSAGHLVGLLTLRNMKLIQINMQYKQLFVIYNTAYYHKTRGWSAGHSIQCITHVGYSIAVNMFLHFVTL